MSQMIFPLRFKRQYAASLDADAVFDTTAEMEAYLTNALRYAGMTVSCLEQEGNIFVLNNDMDAWTKIGELPATIDAGIYFE